MTSSQYNADYLLDSDQETLRLERQARIYGVEDDLRFMAPSSHEQVLDVGCGSGSITRVIARALGTGVATGLDRQPKYVDFARRKAASEGISNIRFETGDATKLPFPDKSFDAVWSKHLLQWVPQREQAVREFVRVTRAGGRVIACNFDLFGVCHYPQDSTFQADAERWFEAARDELGFDNQLGRKLPHLFQMAGMTEITVNVIADPCFGGFGGDPEKRWNWETQFQSVLGFSAKVFGSIERGEMFRDRIVELFSRPDIYVFCPLFYVSGRVA
ncbi:MAG: methyltransferase domain-containing protein [Burkholderiales bacterium]|nr:methyltransferase domain-containing protein [Burkholderiales bacterium]